MSALGALDKSCDSLLALLNDLDTPYNLGNRLISKIMNISIRCTYYIFCRRSKDWTDLFWWTFQLCFRLIQHCISFLLLFPFPFELSLVLSRNSQLHTACYKRSVCFCILNMQFNDRFKSNQYCHQCPAFRSCNIFPAFSWQ